MSAREAVERELAALGPRGLLETPQAFDPKDHPRDRIGRFRNVLAILHAKHPLRTWEQNHPATVEVGAGIVGAVANEIAGMADPGVGRRRK